MFPLAAGISDSINSVASLTKKPPKEVKLSVDLRLQSTLQESIRQWCIDKGRPTSNGVKTLEQVPAFTTLALVDLSGGQVRSLVSEPQNDPSELSERLTRDYSGRAEFAERASRSSWALQPAPVGSTVKALTFSAVASQLDGVPVNGQPFDMGQVAVDELDALRPYQDPRTGETGDRYRALGNLPLLQRGILSESGNEHGVDPKEMLRRSRNWPAVVFGTLGLVSTPGSELSKFLQPAFGGGSTLTFRGRQTQLNFKSLTGSLSAWADLQHMFINSQNLEQTCLAKGLLQLFSPRVLMFEDRETPWPKQTLGGLLPVDLNPLANPASKGGIRWGPLTDAIPEAHVFDTRLLSSVDNLCDYLAGKGEARWSALDMAGNMARLVTGARINPTFKVAGDSTMDSLGGVFGKPEWRRQNLIDPLMSKAQDGRESPTTLMYPLTETRRLLDSKGMKLMFKTGTMDDGGGPEVGRESEMVMFVVGHYGASGFDRKHSVAGFLSIRSARPSGSNGWLRGPLLARVIPDIVEYLSSK